MRLTPYFSDMDVDEDETMHPATYQSQFTRSLMLFVCSYILLALSELD